MSERAVMHDDLKEKIIADPDMVLEDREVMRALMAAGEPTLGENIVDLRGIALDRLESRLDRLEDTHRTVIAAAYENLAGTNQVHRAIMRMLEASDFPTFLQDLSGDVAEILRVDYVRLVLETVQDDEAQNLSKLSDVLSIAQQGSIDRYIAQGRRAPVRVATLRQTRPENGDVYGQSADWIRSEACLKLDFGPGRLPGMLALGSEDPHQFKPTQGTDLLTFFAGVFERAMQRWLA